METCLPPHRPGLRVSSGLTIPEAELSWRFSRSSGPGGARGVNTADLACGTRVGTRRNSAALTPHQRERLLARLSGRLVDGVLTIAASEHRAQLRNRDAARDRLVALVAEALRPPAPPRRATKPSRGSKERPPQSQAATHRRQEPAPPTSRGLSPRGSQLPMPSSSAYVLAGDLGRAAGDHAAAFARYEEIMRHYVATAHTLAPGGVGRLPPARSIHAPDAGVHRSAHAPLADAADRRADARQVPRRSSSRTTPRPRSLSPDRGLVAVDRLRAQRSEAVDVRQGWS